MRALVGLFFIAAVLAVFAQIPSDDDIKKYVLECQKSTNASKDDLIILETMEIPKNDQQACLVGCFYKKLGMVNNNNTVNIDMIEKLFKPDSSDRQAIEQHRMLVSGLKKCAAEVRPSNDLCKASDMYMRCMNKTMGEMEASTSTTKKN